MKDLKQRVIRGGFAKICSQGASFLVRMGSLMILARLLDPKDFGLVGMVTAVIGVFNLFRDFGLSLHGYGYWALVATTTVTPLVYTVCVWLTTAWVPGRPHQRVGLRSMMRFGGTLTLNSLVMYIATNFEKVLLGRFWGADAIGVYGRAYQLVNIPNDNLNSAASGVAFAALSRLQDDPPRFRSYFLKGYALVLSLTVPVTVVCALLAKDM